MVSLHVEMYMSVVSRRMWRWRRWWVIKAARWMTPIARIIRRMPTIVVRVSSSVKIYRAGSIIILVATFLLVRFALIIRIFVVLVVMGLLLLFVSFLVFFLGESVAENIALGSRIAIIFGCVVFSAGAAAKDDHIDRAQILEVISLIAL